MCGFQYICWFLWSPSDTKLNWSFGRTNCLYYSTRVDLYSHQILLQTQFTLNIYVVENGKTYLTSRFWYKICYNSTITQITILQLTNSTHIVLDTYSFIAVRRNWRGCRHSDPLKHCLFNGCNAILIALYCPYDPITTMDSACLLLMARAYLAPGHLQLSWWHRTGNAYQGCHNVRLLLIFFQWWMF